MGRLTVPPKLLWVIVVNPEPRTRGAGVATCTGGARPKSAEPLVLAGEGVTFPISSLTLKCCEETPQSTLYHQSHTSRRWLKTVVLGQRKLFMRPSA